MWGGGGERGSGLPTVKTTLSTVTITHFSEHVTFSLTDNTYFIDVLRYFTKCYLMNIYSITCKCYIFVHFSTEI